MDSTKRQSHDGDRRRRRQGQKRNFHRRQLRHNQRPPRGQISGTSRLQLKDISGFNSQVQCTDSQMLGMVTEEKKLLARSNHLTDES